DVVSVPNREREDELGVAWGSPVTLPPLDGGGSPPDGTRAAGTDDWGVLLGVPAPPRLPPRPRSLQRLHPPRWRAPPRALVCPFGHVPCPRRLPCRGGSPRLAGADEEAEPCCAEDRRARRCARSRNG